MAELLVDPPKFSEDFRLLREGKCRAQLSAISNGSDAPSPAPEEPNSQSDATGISGPRKRLSLIHRMSRPALARLARLAIRGVSRIIGVCVAWCRAGTARCGGLA